MNILLYTPLWVWVILFVLCVLGIKQCKTHTVSLIQILIAPVISALLFVFVIFSYIQVGQSIAGLLVGLGIGMGFGVVKWHKKPLIEYNADTQQWQRYGSIIPLISYLCIFICNYISIAVQYIPQEQLVHFYVNPVVVSADIITSVFIGVLLAMIFMMKVHK